MIVAAAILAVMALVAAGLLRAGGASLVRTARADAIHDAAEHTPGAVTVARLLDDRDAIVPGINIVHGFLLVVAAILASWAITEALVGIGVVVGLVGIAIAAILFGDLIPRTIGRARPRNLAYRLAWILSVAIGWGARAADIMRDADEEVDESEHDEQDEDEVELISSVLEFTETIVREVMVPRPDMITVEAKASLPDLLSVIDEYGFSRIPVVGGDIDDVVGLVIVKDLLSLLAAGDRPASVSQVMRAIDFVPETKRVSDLLREMQASKSHLAIVVDEYGGTSGVVTIEDLLEELVGEIVDEYDEDELLVELLEDGSWRVDGRMPIDDLAEMMSSELPDEDWDTVGGLVLGLAGRVPLEGERYEVGDVIATVTRVQGRRVAEVLMERLELEATGGEQG